MMGIPSGLLKWAPKGRAGDDSQQAEQEVLAHWQQLPRAFLCGCVIVALQLLGPAHAIPPAAYAGLESHLRSQTKGTLAA